MWARHGAGVAPLVPRHLRRRQGPLYTGDAFAAWTGSLFVGGLSTTQLARMFNQRRLPARHIRLLTELNQRIRDVKGSEGLL